MRVESRRDGRSLHYRVIVERDDRTDAESRLRRADRRVRLRGDAFRVELDDGADPPHPDLHAAALVLVLHPFVGRRLELPFAVSAAYAEVVARYFGFEVGPVGGDVRPREAPATYPPALLFSGGMDSTATSLVLPPETIHLFLDRIAHYPQLVSAETLVDLPQQRALCGRLRADGRTVFEHRDDHEVLYDPYPFPHTNMAVLPALFRADRLGLRYLDMGAVMADVYLGGYTLGQGIAAWRFRPPPPHGPDDEPPPPVGSDLDQHLAVLGLQMAKSAVGLSEVATALVVHRSPYRGLTYSCFNRSFHAYCMRCDKCFRKLLLAYAFDDREVPDALVEHFLGHPPLRALLARPYLDFHDVWVYALQRVRCRHPVIAALQAVAQRGPDLGVLAKWYPRADIHVPRAYRAAVRASMERTVGVMTPEEVAFVEQLEVPPLAPAAEATPGGGAP